MKIEAPRMVRHPSGILAPQPVGVHCHFCPAVIFAQNEARGRLFLLGNNPICARCRILRGRTANAIRHDKPRYDKDVIAREERIQAEADAKMRELAAESIKETGTGIIH